MLFFFHPFFSLSAHKGVYCKLISIEECYVLLVIAVILEGWGFSSSLPASPLHYRWLQSR